jgi:hypothetical protein
MTRRSWSSPLASRIASASVISLLHSDPNREDEGHDNAQEHPRIPGPFHFFARIPSRA